MENNGKCTKNQLIGNKGEAAAAKYLENRNYFILDRNFKCKIGELDIVAFDTATEALVFIEVKTRNRTDYGLPCEFVNKHKQQLLKASSEIFISKHPYLLYSEIRFDIFELLILDSNIYYRHLINAF